MTYLGVTRPDDTLVEPIGETPQGYPIFERPLGYLFSLVIEGKPVSFRRGIGDTTFDWDAGDPTVRPALEVIVSNPLGDGSPAVCDNTFPEIGGIPSSTGFAETQENANAVNDLGCRFLNGSGETRGRGPLEACTTFPDGGSRFVASDSQIQFCGLIAEPFQFPVGDTQVTIRLRDRFGGVGPETAMIVRVLP